MLAVLGGRRKVRGQLTFGFPDAGAGEWCGAEGWARLLDGCLCARHFGWRSWFESVVWCGLVWCLVRGYSSSECGVVEMEEVERMWMYVCSR